MAREESDREDMLREAVALNRRAEIQISSDQEPIFLGFKRDGGLSIYLTSDRVYQFNPAGQLRRAYRDGLLYRTQGGTLAELQRDRSSSDRVTLNRRDMTSSELKQFLDDMTVALQDLQQWLSSRLFVSLQTVPEESDLLPEFLASLETILSAEPKLAPAYKGRT